MNLTHHPHYSQQIPSANARTSTFAIQELLGLTPNDLAVARAYADHQAYAAYLSRSTLFPSYQHPPSSFVNENLSRAPTHHSIANFRPTFPITSTNTLPESLHDNFGTANSMESIWPHTRRDDLCLDHEGLISDGGHASDGSESNERSSKNDGMTGQSATQKKKCKRRHR